MTQEIHQTTEEEVRDEIFDLVQFFKDDEGESPCLQNSVMRNYEEVGMLTNDKGFVLTTQDGAEYQITVKQSKAARFRTTDEL